MSVAAVEESFELGGEPLARMGWGADPSAGFVGSADLIDQGAWLVGRLWNTPAVLTSVSLPVGRYRFILTLDGEATIEREGGTHHVGPHQVFLVGGEERLVTRNTVVWARMEWHLALPLLLGSALADSVGRVIPVSSNFEQLVAAVTNVISVGPRFGEGPGGLQLLPALQALVAGVLTEAHETRSRLTPAQYGVLMRARAIIDQRLSDPLLSVADIADELAVSPSYLHRVFSLAGSSPRKEIEQRRVTTARLLLEASPGGRGEIEAIARRAGFTTRRRMHTALQHHE